MRRGKLNSIVSHQPPLQLFSKFYTFLQCVTITPAHPSYIVSFLLPPRKNALLVVIQFESLEAGNSILLDFFDNSGKSWHILDLFLKILEILENSVKLLLSHSW